MANIIKKPAIRFKGFTDAWGQRKLGDISVKVTEKNVHNLVSETFTNSAEYGVISQRDFFDHDIAKAEKVNRYYIIQNNDFVYNPRISVSAPCGPINCNRMGRNGVMSPLYTVFRTYNIDTIYLEWFFKSHYWYSYMYFNGDSGARSDRFSIKNELFFQMPIPTPSIDEQRRIGQLFSNLDNLITLHQRKYDKLVNVKKSMLEKMFPKNGNKIPEIRFKGFTDDWEQRKLGEVGTTFTGLSGKTKEDFGHGDGRFVTYMNVFLNPISDYTRTEAIEIDKSQNAVQYGDVFFTTSSETPEEVGMSSVWLETTENTYLNSFCFGYRPTMKIDPHYMAYMLRSEIVRNKIIYLAQGISRYNISKNAVMEIKVPLPDIAEQAMIGNYFRNLDHLITLHQRKLEKLKNIKKSMLEKMFV